MTEDQIKHMVNRFLGWRLPEAFSPDCGIHFDANAAKKMNPRNHKYEPVGTNLLTATEATAMVRYILEGLPKAITPVPFPYSEECCPGHVASETNSKICGRCGVHVDRFRPSAGPLS